MEIWHLVDTTSELESVIKKLIDLYTFASTV